MFFKKWIKKALNEVIIPKNNNVNTFLIHKTSIYTSSTFRRSVPKISVTKIQYKGKNWLLKKGQ